MIFRWACKIDSMGNYPPPPRSFWLTVLFLTFTANLVMFRLTYLRQVELKSDLLRSAWGGILLLCLGLAIVCAWLMLRLASARDFTWLARIKAWQIKTVFG